MFIWKLHEGSAFSTVRHFVGHFQGLSRKAEENTWFKKYLKGEGWFIKLGVHHSMFQSIRSSITHISAPSKAEHFIPCVLLRKFLQTKSPFLTSNNNHSSFFYLLSFPYIFLKIWKVFWSSKNLHIVFTCVFLPHGIMFQILRTWTYNKRFSVGKYPVW